MVDPWKPHGKPMLDPHRSPSGALQNMGDPGDSTQTLRESSGRRTGDSPKFRGIRETHGRPSGESWESHGRQTMRDPWVTHWSTKTHWSLRSAPWETHGPTLPHGKPTGYPSRHLMTAPWNTLGPSRRTFSGTELSCGSNGKITFPWGSHWRSMKLPWDCVHRAPMGL